MNVSVLFALSSAVLFGFGTAAQHRVSTGFDSREMLRLTLFRPLIANPLWVAGIAFEIGAFGCQLVALHNGSLVVVQPVITLSLVVAFMTTIVMVNATPSALDVGALIAVVSGLGVFLALTIPSSDPTSHSTAMRWGFSLAVLAALGALLVTIGHLSDGARRAWSLAGAAGIADATMATFAKALSDQFGRGFAALFTSWALYAVAGMGVVALLLSQAAYQTARPAISLPVIAVVEPIASVVLGVVVFREHLAHGVLRGISAVLALALMALGIALLARSPLADGIGGELEMRSQ